jgi:hypothetical protein
MVVGISKITIIVQLLDLWAPAPDFLTLQTRHFVTLTEKNLPPLSSLCSSATLPLLAALVVQRAEEFFAAAPKTSQ